jgi:adenylate cyclase
LRFAQGEARELTVTALAVDLRDSTALAAGRLPFDTLFIVDRYVHAVTAAVEAHGGYVTSVAGDGVMSVFGLDGDVVGGTRGALRAAAALWRAVERLSVELGPEIGAPLRFGIGLHTGPAVVGSITFGDRQSLQFLGETGNIAARLEGLTKDQACTMLVSQASLKLAGVASLAAMSATVLALRGAEGLALAALPFHTVAALEAALAA